MEDNHKDGGQWAILPAAVRYDPHLPANAKLIYSEIAAKVNIKGYCYASNRHFSDCFNIKEDSVSRLIRRLADAEYIYIDTDLGRVNGDKRRIYLTSKPYDFTEGIGFKSDTGKISGTVSDLNPGPIENINNKINPPKPPKGVKREKKIADWKPERFEAFWKFYPPVNGKRPAKGRAINAWDKLRPDDETIARMGKALQRDKKSRMWQEGVGIPYASSWINSRAWEDEVVDDPSVGYADISLYTREPEGVYEAW